MTPNPVPPPSQFVSGSTPTSGGSAPATPVASSSPTAVGTPKVADRSTKEAFIIGLSDNDLQHYYLAGLISDAEMVALKGEAKLQAVKLATVTKADSDAAAALKANPPSVIANEFTNYGASGRPGAMSAGNFNFAPAPGTEGQPNASGGFTPSSAAGASKAGTPGTSPTSAGGGATARSGGGGGSSTAAPPPIAGDFVWNNGRPYIAYQGQKYMLPQGVQEDDPRVMSLLQRLGSGNTEGSVIGGTSSDLYLRGAQTVPNNGGTAILNGSQYRNPGAPVQVGEKQWQNVGPDGRPTGAIYSSSSAANLAKQYVDAGVAMTSRFGNSPTAKAASAGGFQQTIDPSKALFPLIGMDQSIAAGATKGQQPGDILGTISNNTKNFYDITQSGISQGGGLTPVGNSMNPYDSFTGQMANGDSIGMSSILGNSGVNTQYWLSQMSGLPPSEVAKLNINTPEKALQFQQAVETARNNGMMPNFASLYALNEPAATGGAYGGSDLKWGSANGGASNTPYDQALAGFANYALGSPDLQYLPDSMPSGSGSIQVGNTAYANSGVDEWGNPLYMANGGQFWTDGMKYLTDAATGRKEAVIGEAGPEKVTVDPMKDVMMGRERNPYMGGGMMHRDRPQMGQNPMHTMGQHQMPQFSDLWNRIPMDRIPQQGQDRLNEIRPKLEQMYGGITQRLGSGGSPTMMAGGGTIYTPGKNGGFTDQYASADPELGYKPDNYLPGGGGTFNPTTQNEFQAPYQSATGQPVPASYTNMSPDQKNQFVNQGGAMPNQMISGPLSAQPVGMQPYGNSVLPVYDQLNPKTYDGNLGEPIGYKYVPMNNGGTPVLVRVPQYNAPSPPSMKETTARDAAYLKALLSGGQLPDPGAYGWSGRLGDLPQDRAGQLALLYKIDPVAAMLAADSGAPQTDGTGDMSGVGRGTTQSDQEIQNEAMRRRYYDTQARNYSRAGLPSPTIIDIPRQTWTPPQNGGGSGGSGGFGSNQPPWGAAQAPYQQYGLPVQNGYQLPFDYEPGSPWFNRGNLPMPPTPMPGGGGGQPSGGGTTPGENTPWGQNPQQWPHPQLPQPGQNWTPWWSQLPDWIRGYQPAGAAA